MDCGDFIKIGVSCNPGRRKHQIPYEVKQYYSTKPIENAFEIERNIHDRFSSSRILDAEGREYFDIGFDYACNQLRRLTDEKFARFFEAEIKKEISREIEKLVPELDLDSLSLVFGIVLGILSAENTANKNKGDNKTAQ